eukprot:3934554-Alexandrium_andersonii.AAC.1
MSTVTARPPIGQACLENWSSEPRPRTREQGARQEQSQLSGSSMRGSMQGFTFRWVREGGAER